MWEIKNALPIETQKDVNTAKALAAGVVANGCIYQKCGIFEPSKTGLMVAEISESEEMFRRTQLGLLGQAFNTRCLSLLENNEEIGAWLGITNQEVDIALRSKPVKQPMVSYFGVDVCGPQGVINDLNVDRATIVGFQPEFIEVFGKEFPWLIPNMVSFYDRLIKEFKNISGKDKPKVFVLTAEDEHYVKPFESFSSRFGYEFGPITDLETSQSDYDLIFRCIKSEVILKDPVKYKLLLDKLAGGLPMINPLGSYLLGNKGWEVLLGINQAGGMDTQGWFPEPVLLYSGSKKQALDNLGNSFQAEELLSKLAAKNLLVAKKAFSFGGYDVTLGKKAKAWEWQQLLNEAMNSTGSWVFETCQEKVTAEVWVSDWENMDTEIMIKPKTLNCIQRLYACGDFPVGFDLTGEVFGGESLKVNASGYTFPVMFSQK